MYERPKTGSKNVYKAIYDESKKPTLVKQPYNICIRMTLSNHPFDGCMHLLICDSICMHTCKVGLGFTASNKVADVILTTTSFL